MQIPLLASFVPHFSKEDCAPVSQLRDIDPKLMAGVKHRQRLHPGDQHAPAEDSGKFRSLRLLRIKVDQFGGGGVEANEMGRLGKRSGVQLRIERLGQACIAVVEGKTFQLAFAHRRSMPGLARRFQARIGLIQQRGELL